MIEEICRSYGDSDIKCKRRSIIIGNLTEHLIENGLRGFTFKKAYEVLEMEKKSLYKYYPNVSMMIIDCVMLTQESSMQELSHFIQTLTIPEPVKNGHGTGLQNFKKALYWLVDAGVSAETKNLTQLQYDFEIYIADLEDERSVDHYKYLKSLIRQNQGFEQFLETALANGEIHIHEKDIPRYANICYQSVIAYTYRYTKKKHDNQYYTADHLYTHVDMLMESLKAIQHT